MNKQKNYHWRIAGFYFFYFAFIGMFAPYWALYFRSLGFSALQISVLMSVMPVMRMVSPALWGWLADHTGKRAQVIRISSLLSLLAYLALCVTTQFYALLFALALMSFFWSASMPLVEAITLSYLGKQTASYGRLRSWGSIGFIVSVVGLGYALDAMQIGVLLWAGVLFELGIYLFSRQMPEVEQTAHHDDHAPILHVMQQPHVRAFLIAGFLMALAHGPYYTFYSIYLVDHGYAKSTVGWLWTIGVVCEIAVFFWMPRLNLRFSHHDILRFSLAAAVLRFLLIAWCVEQPVLLVLAQTLHAATFGSYHAASVALVHEYFRGKHQSRGQALYGSISYGAGGMLGGLLSGPLWVHYGAGAMFSFSAVAALLGLLMLSRPAESSKMRPHA